MAFDALKRMVFDQLGEKINKIILEFIEQERNEHKVPKNKILTVINVRKLKEKKIFIHILSFFAF